MNDKDDCDQGCDCEHNIAVPSFILPINEEVVLSFIENYPEQNQFILELATAFYNQYGLRLCRASLKKFISHCIMIYLMGREAILSELEENYVASMTDDYDEAITEPSEFPNDKTDEANPPTGLSDNPI